MLYGLGIRGDAHPKTGDTGSLLPTTRLRLSSVPAWMRTLLCEAWLASEFTPRMFRIPLTLPNRKMGEM